MADASPQSRFSARGEVRRPTSRADMEPSAFRAGRIFLDLTEEQCGRICGVDGRTIRRWEANPVTVKNTRRLPPSAAQIMKWMLGGYRPPEFPTHDEILRMGAEPEEGARPRPRRRRAAAA